MSSLVLPASGVAVAQPSAGDHSAHLAMRLLWGLPVGLAALTGWQFLMQTSGAFNADERVTGWGALQRDLPAIVLLVAPPVVGLAFAVHAARLGSGRGRRTIWWLSAALLFGSVITVATVLDDTGVGTTQKQVLTWVLPFAVAGGAAAYAWWASSRGHPAPPACGGRYRRAAVPMAAGVVLAFGWLFASQAALTHRAGTFARSPVPGSASVAADGTATYYVYAEGNAPGTGGELDLRVTGPDSRAVDVTVLTPEPSYLRDMRGGRVVASFVTPGSGSYQVTSNAAVPSTTAPYAPQNPYGTFAVGGSVAGWMDPAQNGTTVLLVLALAATCALTWRAGRPRPVTLP